MILVDTITVLVLVDAAYKSAQDVYDPYKLPRASTLPRSSTLPAELTLSHHRVSYQRHDFSDKVQPGLAMAVLLRTYSKQSVFHPPVLPAKWNDRRKKLELDRKGVLLAFLIAAFWETECLRLQDDLQYVRSYAMRNPGQRSFPMLIGLRGHLSRVSDGLRKTRMRIWHEIKAPHGWYVAGKHGGYDHHTVAPPISRDNDNLPMIMTSSTRGRPCFLDWRDLPDMLDQLGKWIDVSAKLVNEEIQLVIGAVQLEDARVMKHQTEWTVVLGVLAAVYLPMTLITGIFGMNITEITTPESAPNKWSVIKAWGVAFGATLGVVLLYMVLKILHRCWLIAHYLCRRAYQRRYIYRRIMRLQVGAGPGRLQQMNQALQNWSPCRAVRAVMRGVRELDLEAQKID